MKSKLYLALVFVILAILFSVLMFYVTDVFTPAWYIAYACILVDIAVVAVSVLVGKDKYAYLRYGPNLILFIGAGVSAAFNLLVMVSSAFWGTTWVLILNLLIIGGVAVLYLVPTAFNASAVAQEQEIAKKHSFILAGRDKVKGCMSLVSDFYLRKEVERVYDAIANAVIDGHVDASMLENAINRNCDLLFDACANNEVAEIKRLCAQLLTDIRKREILLQSKGKVK